MNIYRIIVKYFLKFHPFGCKEIGVEDFVANLFKRFFFTRKSFSLKHNNPVSNCKFSLEFGARAEYCISDNENITGWKVSVINELCTQFFEL